MGCSERRWGPDPDHEVPPRVLQASSFCLTPQGPNSFLFSSPHQQVEGTLLIAFLPSTLPSRARGVGPMDGKAAAGTVCSYVLIPCVMPNDTLPQPGVGVLSVEIS